MKNFLFVLEFGVDPVTKLATAGKVEMVWTLDLENGETPEARAAEIKATFDSVIAPYSVLVSWQEC
jgi:hypothetical protein